VNRQGKRGYKVSLQDRFKDGLARSKNEQALPKDRTIYYIWPGPTP